MDLKEMGPGLERLLAASGWGAGVTVTEIEPLTGGYSLLTAAFVAEVDGERQRLVVRADPPREAALTTTDRSLEWEVLAALTADGRVPMPAARCADLTGAYLGTPGIVLDFVDGSLLLGHLQQVDPAGQADLALRLASAAGAVHSVGEAIVPATVDRPESWEQYIDGFIAGWRALEASHVERDPFIRWLAKWLDEHRPPPAPLTLVHGEFQTTNVIVDAGGDLQIIDWEYAHVGDPRVDLGWIQVCAGFMPPDPIALDPVGFCRRYCEVTGLGEDVVNPLTVGWFAMAGGYKSLGAMLGGQAAMATGDNHLLTSAYLVSVMPLCHRMWRQGVAGMEAAMAAMAEHVEASA